MVSHYSVLVKVNIINADYHALCQGPCNREHRSIPEQIAYIVHRYLVDQGYVVDPPIQPVQPEGT